MIFVPLLELGQGAGHGQGQGFDVTHFFPEQSFWLHVVGFLIGVDLVVGNISLRSGFAHVPGQDDT